MSSKKSRSRGRPVEYPMPDQIPDTPENIMKAFLKTSPKKREDWRFLRERETRKAAPRDCDSP